ncbi:X-ray repair cross-complementing protein 5-like [Artemia franciscana]|uniref:Ku domain-containing protein n=1 Tax=Artemia franciscana TaxID=6661 RepID=A0AA88IEZ7_ARTSF|nr:hypothetical protein QYM36_000474 [Artemia franciscana]KAK2726024.1 hypothetical protein QYM36_000474 [Artemia franciscana]KAK2726025.1 hypothetical protein QYM36_000474 [Artemia franciscana]KAK2726026.1 hypothetical protein QYM36_000474 [Artemia franciscana]KAK2726027.1 hypothetical protein QYM36_000474 [Artemia franciscana]
MNRNKKDAFIIVLDVGPSTSDVAPNEDKSFLKKSTDCVNRIIQRKIFSESKDELAVIAFGTATTKNPTANVSTGYENIYVEVNFKPASWTMLDKVVSRSRTDVVAADWLKALYAAIDYFGCQVDENEKGFNSLTIAFFTDFSSPSEGNEKLLNEVIDSLKQSNITLYFIGPQIPEDVHLKKALSPLQKDGMSKALKIMESLGDAASSLSFLEADVEFAALPKRKKKSMPWKVDFKISDRLRIPVSGYLIVQKEGLPSWKEEATEKPGFGVTRERTHVKKDVEMTEVPADEIITGYQYGSKIIPFSAEDEQQMNYESGPRDFSVICFADATSIHESFFNGNSTMNFIARPGDQMAQSLLSAFIRALSESGKVAIVRRVYNVRNRPTIGFLSPVIKLHAEYLEYINLPYSEDVRKIQFPSLVRAEEKLADDQKAAVDDLIKSMDLTDREGRELYRSVDTLDPYTQYVYQVLSHRQLHPEEPIKEFMDDAKRQAMKPLEVSEELKENAALSLKRVAEVFPIEVIQKRKRKVEELKIGQREEEVLPTPGPSGVQPTAGELSIADILGSKVTAVGTVAPIDDFQTLINRGEDARLACIQLEDVVIRLVVEAPPVSNHYLAVKAIDCLKALRAFCVKVDPDIYNIWTNKLKKALLEKKNFELLNVIREGHLGPISPEENPNSLIQSKDIEEFFHVQTEAEPELTKEVEEENLLEEL